MSSQRKRRATERERGQMPSNFTCGVCHQVHEYNDGFKCPDEPTEDQPEEEED